MRKRCGATALAVIIALFAKETQAWNNGQGMKPPMGWNSELVYGCSITEDIVKETAAYIGSSRMNASGYLYINLGDCW